MRVQKQGVCLRVQGLQIRGSRSKECEGTGATEGVGARGVRVQGLQWSWEQGM